MAYKPPGELPSIMVGMGQGKAHQSLVPRIVMTFLAGAYIALGGFLAVRLGAGYDYGQWGAFGKMIFASVFPVGLLLVVVCGGDLFTGNCMTLSAATGKKKISLGLGLYSGIFSWLGNFVGALFVAYALAYASGLIFDTATVGGEKTMPWAESIVKIANTKCHLPFWEAFWRGVGCNWCVCIAVYAAAAAEDIGGKFIALWFPVMAFVALSMEHCVANMFFIPLGLFTGADARYLAAVEAGKLPALTADWGSFMVDNLIPVTLGNFVGGAVLVAFAYLFAFGKKA